MIQAGEKKRERKKGLGRGKNILCRLRDYKFTERPARDQDIHSCKPPARKMPS